MNDIKFPIVYLTKCSVCGGTGEKGHYDDRRTKGQTGRRMSFDRRRKLVGDRRKKSNKVYTPIQGNLIDNE